MKECKEAATSAICQHVSCQARENISEMTETLNDKMNLKIKLSARRRTLNKKMTEKVPNENVNYFLKKCKKYILPAITAVVIMTFLLVHNLKKKDNERANEITERIRTILYEETKGSAFLVSDPSIRFFSVDSASVSEALTTHYYGYITKLRAEWDSINRIYHLPYRIGTLSFDFGKKNTISVVKIESSRLPEIKEIHYVKKAYYDEALERNQIRL